MESGRTRCQRVAGASFFIPAAPHEKCRAAIFPSNAPQGCVRRISKKTGGGFIQ
ncbi:hypothetical protein CLOSTHATH_06074 [Hungatella hathewayi DSM 13479]|uniref:Uncharacterized protein n=1 Tax=Hungatella hathewayi DSM 13479 TaxID=566550 RepID=D3AR18_9FIRM|nr:hypothetical protein CLOSTHATH_06074 [Hungatella hathewayi DSM 13479]